MLSYVVVRCKKTVFFTEFLHIIYLFVIEQLFVPFRGTKMLPLILNDQTYNIAVLDYNKDECLVDIDYSGGPKLSEET